MATEPHGSCACSKTVLAGKWNRRRVIQLAAAGGLGVALWPRFPWAAEGDYEAMTLYCIDPRVPEFTRNYLLQQGLAGKYSQFVIAGAAIGVVAPAFSDWHKTFWDNLAATIALHRIKKVIAIDHRDCGAAKIAYGEAAVANPTIETQTHRTALSEFRDQTARRHPQLIVQTGLMALDGSVEMFG